MKKPSTSPQPAPDSKTVGDSITLGEYDNAPVVYVGRTIHTVGSVWRQPPEERAQAAGNDDLFTVPKGTKARIVAFGYPAVDHVRCARLKILSGARAGDTGWIVAPRRIDPWQQHGQSPGQLGEWLILVSDPVGERVDGPSALAESPEVIDQILDACQLGDKNAVGALFRMNCIVQITGAIVAQVISFSETPKRKASVAEIDASDLTFPKKRAWCLLVEEPRSEATTEGEP